MGQDNRGRKISNYCIVQDPGQCIPNSTSVIEFQKIDYIWMAARHDHDLEVHIEQRYKWSGFDIAQDMTPGLLPIFG